MWDLQREALGCINTILASSEKINIAATSSISFEWCRAEPYWASTTQCSDGSYMIRIEERLLQEDIPLQLLHLVLYHELAHTCPNSLEHKNRWEKNAAMLYRLTGLPVHENISVLREPEQLDASLGFGQRIALLNVGDFLRHKLLGEGICISLEPLGTDAIMTMALKDGSSRKMMIKSNVNTIRRIPKFSIM